MVFRQTTAAAREARRRGEVAEASRLLRGALALWRGPAFEGLGGAFFEGRRAWLEQLRASAMESAGHSTSRGATVARRSPTCCSRRRRSLSRAVVGVADVGPRPATAAPWKLCRPMTGSPVAGR
ncbi:BTAD domain-containing putative transcriptional regulator [Nonomuraea dietziae]|uniref:BTAD domain-containing putative transcriptional regulator n=1 Tax=Nonomuraea dietziae TaxID=65515 RepID=UPI003CD0889E